MGQQDNRRISKNNVEKARISIVFLPGFNTVGQNDFLGYIDPDLPFNGGVPVTDGEFNKNCIRTITPLHDHHTIEEPSHQNLDYAKWSESIVYYDGLGREIQKIDVKSSAAGADIIQPIYYDDIGRKDKDYLSYAVTQSGENGPGGFRPDAFNEQAKFYATFHPGDEDYSFSNVLYEESPINRILEEQKPGAAWSLNGSKAVEYSYTTNTGSSEVYQFSIGENNELIKEGCYSANRLIKSIVYDEDDNKTIEYKDRSGRVIEARMINGGEEFITHYVYDKFGLLRYVLPPQAHSDLPAGTTPVTIVNSHEMLKKFCFYYEYDNYYRRIIRRNPGAEESYYVYNKRDQLVLKQDGNQRSLNTWSFKKYDALNRPVYQGVYHHTESIGIEEMQILVDGNTYYFEEYNGGSEHGYSNNAFPKDNYEVYSVTYYDKYACLSLASNTGNYEFVSGDLNFNYITNNEPSAKTVGLITASKTLVMEHDNLNVTDNWLFSVNYYDNYSRIIQVKSDNHLGGTDIFSNNYNYTGELIESKVTHDNTSNLVTILESFEYDNAGRILTERNKINNLAEILINENKYNELGQVVSKKIHNTGGDSYLQNVDYTYNIRGWLKGINTFEDPGNDFFTMRLDYTGGVNPCFNGNISALQWNSQVFPELKEYQFMYDGLNRITNATGLSNHYTLSVGNYDKNGNINSLKRFGKTINGFELIDDLSYSYNGNQLLKVDDAADSYNGFSDNGCFNQMEYLYDENGNMIQDLNKQITNIGYNFMNLAERIEFTAATQQLIFFIYDAKGNKIQKRVGNDPADLTTTNYCGRFVYEEDELRYILTDNGRITYDNNDYQYNYFLKDHLGNVRVVFDQDGNVLQDNSYYPFGMQMSGLEYTSGTSPENKYLYNGKELQEDFELDWYDYGARMYDAQIGRWHVVDPMVQERLWLSMYSYCQNSPIIRVDPTGALDDNYYINSNGTIEVTLNNDSFDRFYLKSSGFSGEESLTTLIGQFDKNEHNLIQLRDFSFKDYDFGTSFSFNVKNGNENQSYIRGDALAALFGAMASTSFHDVTIIGVSNSDGTSPPPSVSHVDGTNIDFRYIGFDGSGGRVLLGSSNLDIKRQNEFNDALYKFGWKDLLSEKFIPSGQTKNILLNHTRHYSKSRHHNHLHTQGFNPYLIYYGGTLSETTITP